MSRQVIKSMKFALPVIFLVFAILFYPAPVFASTQDGVMINGVWHTGKMVTQLSGDIWPH